MAEAQQQPEHVRAFISIHLAPSVLQALHQSQKHLEKAMPAEAVRWTPPEQLHLTLKFLGTINTQALPELQSALAAIAPDYGPLQLRAEGLGAFPNLRNPRVIWVGLQGDLAALEQLTARVEQASQSWAEKEEKRGFHPHLTLGRIRENAGRHARAIGQVLQQSTPPPFGAWRAEQFYLMRSQLSPKGAIHTKLAEFPFRKPA